MNRTSSNKSLKKARKQNLKAIERIPDDMLLRTMKGLLIPLVMIATACTQQPESAQEIVDKAIAYSGGDRWSHSRILFDFRDFSYTVERDGGTFRMTRERIWTADSVLLDELSNQGFQRFLNNSPVSVPDSMAPRYSASVNSVIYFFSLPYGLNDLAVNKELLGSAAIDGRAYYKIKVWFDQEGGGEDHEDIFIYWFDKTDYSLDYLAYSYNTDGGGMRFREAINERFIDGIRVVDYVNYKAVESIDLLKMDTEFESGKLKELSRIENHQVSVSLSD